MAALTCGVVSCADSGITLVDEELPDGIHTVPFAGHKLVPIKEFEVKSAFFTNYDGA